MPRRESRREGKRAKEEQVRNGPDIQACVKAKREEGRSAQLPQYNIAPGYLSRSGCGSARKHTFHFTLIPSPPDCHA